jgi:ketosteroid isomerase-like protein
MKHLFLFIAVTVFTSCNHLDHKAATENKFDLDAVKRHINEMNKTYGDRFTHNDTAFYAERYCKDASIMPEQMKAFAGRDSIRHFNYNDGNNKEFKVDILATNIYGNEDLVVEEGTYSFPDGKGGSVDNGKFIAIWKQENDKWKLYREIWNTNNPPAPVPVK